jgi:hypothetical protein
MAIFALPGLFRAEAAGYKARAMDKAASDGR